VNYEAEEIRLVRFQDCRPTADLLRYLDYLFENTFLLMTQVDLKLYCIVFKVFI